MSATSKAHILVYTWNPAHVKNSNTFLLHWNTTLAFSPTQSKWWHPDILLTALINTLLLPDKLDLVSFFSFYNGLMGSYGSNFSLLRIKFNSLHCHACPLYTNRIYVAIHKSLARQVFLQSCFSPSTHEPSVMCFYSNIKISGATIVSTSVFYGTWWWTSIQNFEGM